MKKIYILLLLTVLIPYFCSAQEAKPGLDNDRLSSPSKDKVFSQVFSQMKHPELQEFSIMNLYPNTFKQFANLDKKVKLDSLEFAELYLNFDWGRLCFEYDPVTKKEIMFLKMWDSTANQLVTSFKIEHYFNDFSNIIKTESFSWNKDLTSWIPLSKSEKTYNNNQELIKEIYFKWDEVTQQYIYNLMYEYINLLNQKFSYYSHWIDNVWIINKKEIETFDLAGNLVCYTYQSRQNGILRNIILDEYFYDDSNRVIKFIHSYCISEVWEQTSIIEYFYDFHNLLTQELCYSKVDTTWKPSLRTDYLYDEQDNLKQTLKCSCYNGVWENSGKTEYEYDATKRLVTYNHYCWLDSTWHNSEQKTWLYDTPGNVLLEEWSDWNEEEDQWMVTYKRERIFNNNYLLDELIMPYFFLPSLDYKSMLINSKTYESNQVGELFLWTDETYFYSPYNPEGITTTDEIPQNVYPNPVDEYLIINTSENEEKTLIIYDLHGKLVHACKTSGNETIYIPQLSNGMYFYRLLGYNNESTGKIIIKK